MQTVNDNQDPKLVLLVEDHDFVAQSLKALLESLQYSVIHVTNARKALNLCEIEHFQLVLLDIGLIFYGAFWIAEGIRKLKQSMPILGYRYRDISPRLMEMALESGMQDVCEHWVSKYMLVQTLNKWCPNNVTLNYKHYW